MRLRQVFRYVEGLYVEKATDRIMPSFVNYVGTKGRRCAISGYEFVDAVCIGVRGRMLVGRFPLSRRLWLCCGSSSTWRGWRWWWVPDANGWLCHIIKELLQYGVVKRRCLCCCARHCFLLLVQPLRGNLPCCQSWRSGR